MISSFASLADAFLKETYDDSPSLACRPTQAASYLTGMLEILAIRERGPRPRSRTSSPPAPADRAILGERVAA